MTPTQADAFRGVMPPPESLESYIARVRAVSAEARVRPLMTGLTIESQDPALRDALVELALGPTADRHRRVGMEYQRLGILDLAHAHYSRAVKLNPKDAASHDALARIWRAWGFPYLGLANAYNAVYFAPQSSAAANTMGTLFADGGNYQAALKWFERAVTLDPQAPYALNNVCDVDIRIGAPAAVEACRHALESAPDSPLFRNNLALAYAASGDLGRAREAFAASHDRAAAAYNMGIVHMARREYDEALDEFSAALRVNPALADAAARAQQARQAAQFVSHRGS